MSRNRMRIEKKYVHYIEIFLLILISVAPYLSMSIKIGLQVLLVIVNISRIKRISIYFYLVLVLMLIPSIIDIFNISAGNPYSGNNLLYPLSFLVGALIGSKYELKSFIAEFEKVLYALGILSLVGMSIYYIAPNLISSFPSYTFYTLKHKTLYFFNFIYAQGFLMVRNSGIAWEPGVFQVLMNLGLSITIMGKGKIDYKRIVVYSLAVIFTKSTTGLLIFMFNLVLLIRKKKIYVILLLIAAGVFSSEIYDLISDQLANKLMGSVAYSNRYDPTINALKYGIMHPLGIGSTGYNALYERMGLGSFDSYTQILMRYGYGMLFFVVYTIINISKKHWYVGIILAVSMISESLWSCVLFTTIYFIYLSGNRVHKEGSKLTDEMTLEEIGKD